MQSEFFRAGAAEVWRWVANVAENPDFADLAEQSTKTLLHPGFVGQDYPTDGTGTLVIGMNPGGGGDTPNVEERDTLKRIKKEATVEAFDRLNAVAGALFRQWPIWRNNLLPLFESVGVAPISLAYIHAVPFRVADNAQLAGLYAKSWQRVASKQVALLNPGRIVLAGKTAGQRLQPLLPVKSRIITRSIGDSLHANHSVKIAASHAAVRNDAAFWE